MNNYTRKDLRKDGKTFVGKQAPFTCGQHNVFRKEYKTNSKLRFVLFLAGLLIFSLGAILAIVPYN